MSIDKTKFFESFKNSVSSNFPETIFATALTNYFTL